MKRSMFVVGASLFCVVGGFAAILFTSGLGTAADDAKKACASCETGVHVGTVMMWWGSRDSVPAGWEICDGQAPTTANATLTGDKPNLTDRFPKGALPSRKTISDLTSATGGSNHMPALKIAKLDGLKILEDGAHTHSPLEKKGQTKDEVAQAKDDDAKEILLVRDEQVAKSATTETESEGEEGVSEGAHSHAVDGFVGSEQGIDADGNDKTGANQPAYAEMFFIIRVK